MSSTITRSARGMPCQIRMPFNVCSHDPAQTVWCHANGSAAGKGMWMKSHALLGAYGCARCHDVYDRRVPAPKELSRAEVEVCFWEGHARSIVLLIERGLIVMKQGKAVIAA